MSKHAWCDAAGTRNLPATDVVVEVATHSQTQGIGELFSNSSMAQIKPAVSFPTAPTEENGEAPPSRVKEPPKPRMPTMSAASGSEVSGRGCHPG